LADQKNAAGTTTPALSETEKKVLDYIKKYESQKYSDAEIVKALEKSGIDQATIKKCMGLTKGKAPLYKNKWFLIIREEICRLFSIFLSFGYNVAHLFSLSLFGFSHINGIEKFVFE